MNPTELAKVYMVSFFGENSLEKMRLILADDLKFSGPFYQYDRADDYIHSLEENMPTEKISYEILEEYGNEKSCCIVYMSKKEGANEIMAQLFEVDNNKIIRIRLILDASKLLRK